jgi:hypothetical protein
VNDRESPPITARSGTPRARKTSRFLDTALPRRYPRVAWSGAVRRAGAFLPVTISMNPHAGAVIAAIPDSA